MWMTTPPIGSNRNRLAGGVGGKITASRMTPDQRIRRSSHAGNATLQAYGVNYYSFLGRLNQQKKKR
jgi:hypothetical protein